MYRRLTRDIVVVSAYTVLAAILIGGAGMAACYLTGAFYSSPFYGVWTW